MSEFSLRKYLTINISGQASLNFMAFTCSFLTKKEDPVSLFSSSYRLLIIPKGFVNMLNFYLIKNKGVHQLSEIPYAFLKKRTFAILALFIYPEFLFSKSFLKTLILITQ